MQESQKLRSQHGILASAPDVQRIGAGQAGQRFRRGTSTFDGFLEPSKFHLLFTPKPQGAGNSWKFILRSNLFLVENHVGLIGFLMVSCFKSKVKMSHLPLSIPFFSFAEDLWRVESLRS